MTSSAAGLKLSMWPKLPHKAAYLKLSNPARRNALSLSVLQSLRSQLIAFNTSPDGNLRILPPFDPTLLSKIEAQGNPEYTWLTDAKSWNFERRGLPDVVILRSEGNVFCSGHDLGELKGMGRDEVKETFDTCAEVMSLIRRSPVPVVGRIQGLATAAGCQLALTTDLTISNPSTLFRLPGAALGLPCTSPSTAVSRKLGPSLTYRMLALAEPVKAESLGSAVDVVGDDSETCLDTRIEEVLRILCDQAAQPRALGKWAYWTQVSLRGHGDGMEEAAKWTGRVMALHARAEDAQEGMESFVEKRIPEWKT